RRRRYLPHRLSRQEMGATRVLRRGCRADVSGQPVSQEGRLQAVRRAGHPESSCQRQPDLLAADVRRIPEAPVSAAQRLSRAKGHARLRGAQREDDECEPVVLSHRSTGHHPQEVDHRERADDGRVQRDLAPRYPRDRRQALTMAPIPRAPTNGVWWLAVGLLLGSFCSPARAESPAVTSLLKPMDLRGYPSGTTPPLFNGHTLEARRVSIADLRGKV